VSLRVNPESSINAISQNLFAQVDQEGNRLLLMDDIVDYRLTNEAMKAIDAFTVSKDGKRRCQKATTMGWEFLVGRKPSHSIREHYTELSRRDCLSLRLSRGARSAGIRPGACLDGTKGFGEGRGLRLVLVEDGEALELGGDRPKSQDTIS
jgi:hypothetical protein